MISRVGSKVYDDAALPPNLNNPLHHFPLCRRPLVRHNYGKCTRFDRSFGYHDISVFGVFELRQIIEVAAKLFVQCIWAISLYLIGGGS